MINLRQSSNNLSEDTLKCLEQFFEFGLPLDYREFLLKYNGGYPDKTHFKFKEQETGSVIQAFFGITPKNYLNLLVDGLKGYQDRIPKNMFPIAYDVFGNLILISVKGPDRNKIYFWDHEMEADEGEEPDYSNLTLVADNFTEFVNSLHDFDESTLPVS